MNTKCIICSSDNTRFVLDIKNVPIYCNVLWKNRHLALNAPKGNIDLYHCNDCDHLFNSNFDPSKNNYNTNYDASLDHSQYFQKYAKDLALKLANKFELKGKSVIEIASGKGDFLKLLSNISEGTYTGFDPSYDHRHNSNKKITIIQDYYDSKYRNYPADIIICRQALEHFEKPTDFLKELFSTIDQHKRVNLFFEVPNSLFSLRDLSIWDFIYEHVSYFSTASLTKCFQLANFQVEQCYESYDGQFLCIEATSNKTETNNLHLPLPATEYIEKIKDYYKKQIIFWNKELRKTDNKIVLWGAGSKGITFLNCIDYSNTINYIIDLNPSKHGKFIPGKGQQVMPPSFLKKYKPDHIIVMNPIYKNEIQAMLDNMNIKTEVISVNEVYSEA